MKDMVREPKSKFLKVICSACNNEQVIFNKSSSPVKCLVCGDILVSPTGGKAKIKTIVLQVL